ncbi:hypothetical protein FEM48_Zijuj10G0047500 [Ziziphus jujuba var. spinosa]|uniref:DOC domain-containing protein n=1 Tax=Ziziphus jujuba var. spinosa TaxID=714518 RepID=A0A978ULD3_ZIZJJ|nr:hypothetical protein FEM48_Zijuj10G0047500 [Ziziphus jujuba var. spinosa]
MLDIYPSRGWIPQLNIADNLIQEEHQAEIKLCNSISQPVGLVYSCQEMILVLKCCKTIMFVSEIFISTFVLQIVVLSNHFNGRDIHVRQIRVYVPRP